MSEFTIEEILKNRRLWTNNLKSGEFRQTTGELAAKDYGAFCCLGVAEEVVGPTLPDELKISRLSFGEYGMKNPEYEEEYDEYDEEEEYIIAEGNLHLMLRKALGLST